MGILDEVHDWSEGNGEDVLRKFFLLIGEGGTGDGRRSATVRSSLERNVEKGVRWGMESEGRREAKERARWISFCRAILLCATVALRLREPIWSLEGGDFRGAEEQDAEAVGGSSRNAAERSSVACPTSSTETGMGTSPRMRLIFRDLRRSLILSFGSSTSVSGTVRRG